MQAQMTTEKATMMNALYLGTMDAMSIACETGNKRQASAILGRTVAMRDAKTISQAGAEEIAGIYVETFGGI